MTQIAIERIIVGDRFRKDLGDVAALAHSMKTLGLLQPIGLDESHKLLWGHRRLEAAKLLGWASIEAKVADLDSLLVEHDENEMRKEFSSSERVAIGKALEERVGERRGQPESIVVNLPQYSEGSIRQNFDEYSGQRTRDVAAKQAGFGSGKTYDYAKKVVEQGTPELIESVDRNEVSVSAAASVATLPFVEQREIVARGPKEILAAAKQIRGEKRQETLLNKRTVAQNLPSFGGKKMYNVIYADPPWEYSNSGVHGAANHHYHTMSTDRIESLLGDLGVIVSDNAILFLWITNPLMAEAFHIIERWGFRYKSNLVWIKRELKKPGSGFYVRGRHELLFIATRGNFTPLEDVAPPIGSVIESPIQEHSRKPEEVYEIIERLYPGCNYLELFARQNKRSGWDSWGNES